MFQTSLISCSNLRKKLSSTNRIQQKKSARFVRFKKLVIFPWRQNRAEEKISWFSVSFSLSFAWSDEIERSRPNLVAPFSLFWEKQELRFFQTRSAKPEWTNWLVMADKYLEAESNSSDEEDDPCVRFLDLFAWQLLMASAHLRLSNNRSLFCTSIFILRILRRA